MSIIIAVMVLCYLGLGVLLAPRMATPILAQLTKELDRKQQSILSARVYQMHKDDPKNTSLTHAHAMELFHAAPESFQGVPYFSERELIHQAGKKALARSVIWPITLSHLYVTANMNRDLEAKLLADQLRADAIENRRIIKEDRENELTAMQTLIDQG